MRVYGLREVWVKNLKGSNVYSYIVFTASGFGHAGFL